MEELRGLIQLNEKKIAPTTRLKRVDSLYPIYKEFIAEEEGKAREFIASNPNRQKIDNLIKRWESHRAQLSGWETEIMTYVERNLRLLESFEGESEVWTLTYDRVKEQDVPNELLSNVQSVIQDLKNIERQTRENNYTYLRLQTRINRLGQTVEEVVRLLLEKKGSETYNLFHQRHPPLWEISFNTEDAQETRPETLSEGGVGLLELYQTHKEKIYFLLVFALGISLFIVYLRRILVRTVGKDSVTQPSSDSYLLFKMPALVVVFLVIFIARLQLLSGTRFMGDILITGLLLCSVLLIIHKVSSSYRSLIFLSILFVILDSIKTYVWFQSGHYRLFLMGEAALMAGVIFFCLRPYRKTKAQMTTPMGTFMIRLVPLVYFLCALSVVSNLFGYTNLSDLTIKICTQSGIAAIIAYGLYLVFESIFKSWLEQRFHRAANPNWVQYAFLRKRIGQFIRFLVILMFVIGFLNIIDEMRNVEEFFSSMMNEPIIVGNLTFTLGSIFMFLLILLLSYIASRLIAFLISEEYGMLQYFRLPKGIPSAISLVLRYSIIVFGIILALSYLNVDLGKFNLMAGALGLGIGFGLQTVISNFVSGLILVFERPILPGDTIEVNNLFGKVHKIGVRSSNIKTYDGAEVVVPNNNLISNDLINWTLSESIRRIEILIGTTYDADPNQVLEVLKGCAQKFDFVLKDREPVVHFRGFGESSLDFRLWFWVPFDIGLKAQSDVNVEIFNQFAAHNIVIPYPQRDIHIKDVPAKGQAAADPSEPGER
jgi:small-conductance mechanosensitive channel